jgi:hypothetical protein
MGNTISSHCACPTPVVVDIPGAEGAPGTPGTNGINGQDGINAFTLVANPGFTPPAKGSSVTIPVMNSVWAAIGQYIVVQGGYIFQVAAIPSTTSITATYLNIGANTATPSAVVAGATVSPSGPPPFVTGLTNFTIPGGLTISNSIAATVGYSTLAFQIDANKIVAADLMTTYKPGYAFKLIAFDARANIAVSTTPCAATVSLKISGAAVTGGAIALNGAYALGAAQAGSAITALNTGTSSDTITIIAASVTAFTEGSFMLYITIQNLDTANAIASIATQVNSLVTDLS